CYFWLYDALVQGDTSEHIMAALLIAGVGAVFAVFLFLLGFSKGRSRASLSTVHGSARWADKKDLIEAGLLPRPGTVPTEVSVYTGGWYDSKNNRLLYLIHGGPEHILAFAPTRSGKGVGLVIPSLLRWADSVLVYDIKGENYQLTSGWRKEELGSIVIKLDPTDPEAFEKGTSGTFNPLEELVLDYGHRETPEPGTWPQMEQLNSGETASIQNLVTMIVDPDGKGLEDHWAKTAHSLIVGCITHLLYVGKRNGRTPCLADVVAEFTKPGVSWRVNIEQWQQFPHLGESEFGPMVHPVVNNAAQEMLNRDDREASSVLSTTVSYLTLYRDPVIAKNTSRSSFHIKDLMNHEQPVSLYLVVKPVDKDRIRPFVRLFITQVIRRLADTMEFKDGQQVKTYKHRLLLMLDEFPSLGRLQIFEEALAFIAGYGLKAYLIIQDIAQLHKIYGKDEAITGNCHVKVAYATSNPDTARYLSESSGTTTVIKEAESLSRDQSGIFGKRNVSISLQEVQRPLLTVDECMRLKGPEKDATGKILTPGDMLIFIAGYAAVYGRQMLYFLDPEFNRRVKINAPLVSDRTIETREGIQDALNALLEKWEGSGDPDEPAIWELEELAALGAIDISKIEIVRDPV
ncbi:MAG: type IV secretory system conjugative DNA transfer family protein, partial [Fretibacterium sp.]|nr:type IV secretory system conjugative DNA transfer family protein [Fretibacterium sp.]